MKYKTSCRLFGLYQAAVFSLLGYLAGVYTTRSDDSLWIKLGTSAITGVCALGAIDGVVDTIKGLHHYFGLQLMRRLSHSERTRQEIDDSIDAMRYWANKETSEMQRSKRRL